MNDIKTANPGGTVATAKVVALRPDSSSPQPATSSSPDTRPAAAEQVAAFTKAETQAIKQSQQQEEAQQNQLKEAVTKLNDYVQSIQRDLSFELDRGSGKTVVKVVDRQTQEVVRQIPDEVAIKLAENLQHDEPLTLFNIRV